MTTKEHFERFKKLLDQAYADDEKIQERIDRGELSQSYLKTLQRKRVKDKSSLVFKEAVEIYNKFESEEAKKIIAEQLTIIIAMYREAYTSKQTYLFDIGEVIEGLKGLLIAIDENLSFDKFSNYYHIAFNKGEHYTSFVSSMLYVVYTEEMNYRKEKVLTDNL